MESKELLKHFGKKKLEKENKQMKAKGFDYKLGLFSLNEPAKSENQREFG